MIKRYLVLPILALGWVAQPALAAINFDSDTVFAGSVASTDQDPGRYDNEEYDSVFVGLIAISDSITADNFSPAPAFTAIVSAINISHTMATVTDSAHGTVYFSGKSTATITAAGYGDDPQAAATASGMNAFAYIFDTSSAIALTVAYSTSDDGLGSGQSEITVSDLSAGGSSSVLLPINGMGMATFDFSAPGTYDLTIAGGFPADNVSQAGAVGETDATMTDYYSFAITPAVPEPATWLTMLVGFVAVGVSIRRQPGRDLRRT